MCDCNGGLNEEAKRHQDKYKTLVRPGTRLCAGTKLFPHPGGHLLRRFDHPLIQSRNQNGVESSC